MIHDERIKMLNQKESQDKPFVIYWMQSAQRTEYNHALEYAIQQANHLHKPLIVYFGLTDDFPEANQRHYRFLLEGLKEVRLALAKRNIALLIRKTSPEKGAWELSSLAAFMVVDRGYLRIERQWRDAIADQVQCPIAQVETNIIVPVESASSKEEYAAATLRPKINKLLPYFTLPLPENKLSVSSIGLPISFETLDINNIDLVMEQLDTDRSIIPITDFHGGTSQAKKLLEAFIKKKLPFYSQLKNEPGLDYSSELSPYLHFGQISPLYIALRLTHINLESKTEFLEELIVRRELSMNFVYYNEQYDAYESLPFWAQKTLGEHLQDERTHLYTLDELEKQETHDPYWNAAQKEMMLTGKMHGYMRMYWSKKILEWSITPQEAFQNALFLNNKYSLDGRDPNSFAGVAWCFGKHDRAWKEREIFGKIRYMNANGLNRKFDMEHYLQKMARLAKS